MPRKHSHLTYKTCRLCRTEKSIQEFNHKSGICVLCEEEHPAMDDDRPLSTRQTDKLDQLEKELRAKDVYYPERVGGKKEGALIPGKRHEIIARRNAEFEKQGIDLRYPAPPKEKKLNRPTKPTPKKLTSTYNKKPSQNPIYMSTKTTAHDRPDWIIFDGDTVASAGGSAHFTISGESLTIGSHLAALLTAIKVVVKVSPEKELYIVAAGNGLQFRKIKSGQLRYRNKALVTDLLQALDQFTIDKKIKLQYVPEPGAKAGSPIKLLPTF